MEISHIPIEQLHEAPWNSNSMSDDMLDKLCQSISNYGLAHNLVARRIAEGEYEVLSGNQRLQVLRQMDFEQIPCHVVDLDDANARLMAMALNDLTGTDDPGLKGDALRIVLESIAEKDVLSVLPESASSLAELVNLGTEDLGAKLREWELSQAAKLRHFTAQLLPSQSDLVQEAIERVLPRAKEQQGGSPNVRGVALYLICREYLELAGEALP